GGLVDALDRAFEQRAEPRLALAQPRLRLPQRGDVRRHHEYATVVRAAVDVGHAPLQQPVRLGPVLPEKGYVERQLPITAPEREQLRPERVLDVRTVLERLAAGIRGNAARPA